MTYNPGAPQPTDIPADNQDDFLDNFDLLNQFFANDHTAFGNTVTFATNANPCVCTSPNHGLASGNQVYISHFASLVGDIITLWNINGGPYTATVIDANTFSLNIDASANPTYLANTGAFASSSLPYGQHKKTFFPNVVNQGPNTSPPLGSPYSAYYSKQVEKVAQLFFQNGVGESFEKQMTQLSVMQGSTKYGAGFITPWGVIINMGPITVFPVLQTYVYPVEFQSSVWSLTATIISTSSTQPQIIVDATSLTNFSAQQQNASAFAQARTAYYIAIGK
jgi:hypothetical protein